MLERIFKVRQSVVKSPPLQDRPWIEYFIDIFYWVCCRKVQNTSGCVELNAWFLSWEETLRKILHISGSVAAPCLQHCCIGSFFHVNTCSLGNGPTLPKSSQMAWVLYPCQSALEFNNNHEVKLGPFLIANPPNHLAFPFLWLTVECMCWGEGGGWRQKKRSKPILCFLKDNPLSIRADRGPWRS